MSGSGRRGVRWTRRTCAPEPDRGRPSLLLRAPAKTRPWRQSINAQAWNKAGPWPTGPSCRHTSARLPRSRMQVSPASPVACSVLLTAVLPRLRKPTWWFGRTRKFEVAPMLPDALRGSQLSPCSPRRHSFLLHLAQVEPAPTGTTTPMKHCVHASATTRASMLDSIG